jgi:uncharacterized protein YggL (DUF469 family)
MRIKRNAHFKTRRLQKKWHQGSFKELGVDIEATWIETPKDFDKVIDDTIDFIESLDLQMFAYWSPSRVHLIVGRKKGSISTSEILKVSEYICSKQLKIVTQKTVDMWE